MAEQTITLQPGESQEVSFEATPQEAREYQVTVDGLSGSFKALAPLQDQFYIPPEMPVATVYYSTMLGYYVHDFECPITNNGDAPGTHTISWWPTGEFGAPEPATMELTLGPGEVYNWVNGYFAGAVVNCWLQGDWEGDNYSVGTPVPI